MNERYATDEKFRERMKEHQRKVRDRRKNDPYWIAKRKEWTDRHIAKVGIEAWRAAQKKRQSLHYTKKRAREVLLDMAKLVPSHSAEVQYRDSIIRTHVRDNDPYREEKLDIYNKVWSEMKRTGDA